MCAEADCACEILAAVPDGRSPTALAEGLRRIGRLSARADAHRAVWLAEAERTDAARKEGFRSTTEWLAALTGEPVPVCRSQIAVAEALQEMPETRKAFAAGEVSEARVKALAQAQALCPEQFDQDEITLVAQVAAAPARQIPKVLAAWKREADPQAAETEVGQLRELRALHLSPGWLGMVHLSGDLDSESGLTVTTALDALTDPTYLDPSDRRTPAQARADALAEVCRRYLQGGNGSRRPPRNWSPFRGTPSGAATGWSTLRWGRSRPRPPGVSPATPPSAGSSATPSRCPSRWAEPPEWFQTHCADSSNYETPTAPTPAVTCPPASATPTT